MVLSIFVYTLTGIALYFLGKSASSRDSRNYLCKRKNKFWYPEVIWIIIIFVFIAAFRFKVGSDYGSYARQYISLQNFGSYDRKTFEIGFTYISELFAKNGFHFCLFFGFWAFLQIFLLYYGLKDRKFLYPYIGLSIMLTPFFIEWMNGMRQCVVCCLFVYLSIFIKDKKFIPYCIGIFFGSLIHKSALLLLPVYFIPFNHIHITNRKLNICILLLCTILGNIPTWYHSLTFATNISNLLGYDFYSETMDELVTTNRDMTWGPIRIMLLFTNILIIWHYPKIKKLFKSDNMINIYFTLFFIGVCLDNLLVMAGIIFSRPAMYFTTFGLIMTAYTLCGLHKLKNKRSFYFFATITLSYIYMALLKLYLNGTLEESVIRYRFIFLENNIMDQLYNF